MDLMENWVVVMAGPNRALLLDTDEEIVVEDDVYKNGVWIKRTSGGYPTSDEAAFEEGC